MLRIIENSCSIWKEVKMTNFNLFTSLILSQYFVKYTLNLGLFFHTWLCFKAFVASSLSWIVSDQAIRLSWHKTSFLICESPLSILFNHLSHDCSRWKWQINTLQSVVKQPNKNLEYLLTWKTIWNLISCEGSILQLNKYENINRG